MTAPPRDSSTVRVCPVRDIVCSTPNECDQRETGCMMLINLPPELDHLRAATAPSAEPPAQAATDDLVRRLDGYNPPDRTIAAQRQIAVDIANASAALKRQAREIARWNELHRVIAEELDCDQETWPDHRNAPLAIGATFVLIKQRAERAEAERDAMRECVRAADAMRERMGKLGWSGTADAYDAARAKVKP